jgi:hypothetical protein
VKVLSSLLILTLISGCQLMPRLEWGPEPIVVQPEPQIVTVTEKVPLRIYQPPLPQEIDLLSVNFFVITEENIEEKVKEIEKIEIQRDREDARWSVRCLRTHS